MSTTGFRGWHKMERGGLRWTEVDLRWTSEMGKKLQMAEGLGEMAEEVERKHIVLGLTTPQT